MQKLEAKVTVRPAVVEDMPLIRGLIREYPKRLVQKDLPRTPSFFVAELAGRVVGCCALQIYSRRLGEVRSLAIHPEFRGMDIGRKLVAACQTRARERGVKQLLAVTSEVMFFECYGFKTFFGERIALFFDIPQG
jgi:N-acetylglutamate synthase-like GNAT family acetyltransferase